MSFLYLLMYAAETEGEGQMPMEEPVGLTQEGLSVGIAEFVPLPGTVAIERVVVEAGNTMEIGAATFDDVGPGWMGMDVGNVESGAAELVVERREMDALVWPDVAADGLPGPERLVLSGTVDMQAGDAYAIYNSTLTWTAQGDEPLTILRVVIEPIFE